MLYLCLLILITLFEIQTGIASNYSEVSIIENLPLEKNHFSENSGKVQHILSSLPKTSDSTHKILCLHLGVLKSRYDRKSVNHLQALFIWCILEICSWKNMYNL